MKFAPPPTDIGICLITGLRYTSEYFLNQINDVGSLHIVKKEYYLLFKDLPSVITFKFHMYSWIMNYKTLTSHYHHYRCEEDKYNTKCSFVPMDQWSQFSPIDGEVSIVAHQLV